jgi:hypothetical protein
MRRAARSCPGADTPPLFLEPLLVGGIYWTVSEYVRTGRAELLPGLLPDLLESTLAYYLDPTEPRPPRTMGLLDRVIPVDHCLPKRVDFELM